MRRYSFAGTGTSAYTGSAINVSESDVRSIFATLFGYSESSITVTFKDMDANGVQRTSENLLWWGQINTSNPDNVKGQIIIDINPDLWHFSEIYLTTGIAQSQPYDRTLAINASRIILDNHTCLDTWGGGGQYRNIVPLNRCTRWVWLDIDSRSAHKDIYYAEHDYRDGGIYPIDPPAISSSGVEQILIANNNDAEGKNKFDAWAKRLGFKWGKVQATGNGEHWVKVAYPANSLVPTLYFVGFCLVFKTDPTRSKIKFKRGSYVPDKDCYKQSDFSGQICITTGATNNGVGELIPMSEINISMGAEVCYLWDKQPLTSNSIIPISITGAPTRNLLPNGGASVAIDDCLYPLTDLNLSWINNYCGGMVSLPNFEITSTGSTQSYKAYSYLDTRLENQIEQGNYVFDSSLTNINRKTLNKSWKFNFNSGWIPVLLYYPGLPVTRDGKIASSYDYSETSVTITYTDNSTRIIPLKNNDKLVKYIRSPGTVSYFKPRRQGASTSEQCMTFKWGRIDIFQWGDNNMHWTLYAETTPSTFAITVLNTNAAPTTDELTIFKKIIESVPFDFISAEKPFIGDHTPSSTPCPLVNTGPANDSNHYTGFYRWEWKGSYERFRNLNDALQLSYDTAGNWHTSSWSNSSQVDTTHNITIYTDTNYLTLWSSTANGCAKGILPNFFSLANTALHDIEFISQRNPSQHPYDYVFPTMNPGYTTDHGSWEDIEWKNTGEMYLHIVQTVSAHAERDEKYHMYMGDVFKTYINNGSTDKLEAIVLWRHL